MCRIKWKICDFCWLEIPSYEAYCYHCGCYCGDDTEDSNNPPNGDTDTFLGRFFTGILKAIGWLRWRIWRFFWRISQRISWWWYRYFFLGILKAIGYTIALAIGCIILYLDTFLLENDYWHLEFIF